MDLTQVSNEPHSSDRLLNRLSEIAQRPFFLTILSVAAIVHLAALFGRLPERAMQTDLAASNRIWGRVLNLELVRSRLVTEPAALWIRHIHFERLPRAGSNADA